MRRMACAVVDVIGIEVQFDNEVLWGECFYKSIQKTCIEPTRMLEFLHLILIEVACPTHPLLFSHNLQNDAGICTLLIPICTGKSYNRYSFRTG